MKRTVLACTLIGLSTACAAKGLPVTADAVFTLNRQEIVISRTSSVDPMRLSAFSARTSTCPAPCLSPIIAAPYITTFGELDGIDFLFKQIESVDGLMIDARPVHPRWHPMRANISPRSSAIFLASRANATSPSHMIRGLGFEISTFWTTGVDTILAGQENGQKCVFL